MVNKEILKQIGFEKCDKTDGWDHEVWWYPIDCWVHFNNKSVAEFTKSRLGKYLIINGDSESMADFFKEFLSHYGETIFQSCRIVKGYNE